MAGRGRKAASARQERESSGREVSLASFGGITRVDLGLAALVFGLAVGVYAGSLGGGFVLDDTRVVAANPLIRSLSNLPGLFAADYWEPGFRGGLYRPLVISSYALNHAVGGLSPVGYHAVNLLLHGFVSVLVFLLFRLLPAVPAASTPGARAGSSIGSQRGLASLGALLFAVHAVHTEAVANVAGRAELLAASGFLVALLLHARRDDSSRVAYGLSLASYGFALLCKESAITLIGVLVLYDVCFPRVSAQADVPPAGLGASLRRVLAERTLPVYAGYVAVTLVYLGLRWLALSDGPLAPPTSAIDNPLYPLPAPLRWVNALAVGGRYLGLLIAPLRLSYDYSYDQIPVLASLVAPVALLALAVAVAGAGAWLWSYTISRRVFFAIGFSLVTFSVVSNLVVPIGTILGERLLYVPSIGFCLGVAIALTALLARLPLEPRVRPVAVAVLGLLLVVPHAWRSVERTRDWHSERSLYLGDVDVSTRSFKAMNNAGWILIDEELDVARGVDLLERAIAAQPDQFEYLDSLGWGYFKLGRYAEARVMLERSLEIEPDDLTAPIRRAHLRAVEQALRGRQ